jgi:hypothetical protein
MFISLSLLGNGSEKHYRGNEYTSKKRIAGGIVFYMVHIILRKVSFLLLYVPPNLTLVFPQSVFMGFFFSGLLFDAGNT